MCLREIDELNFLLRQFYLPGDNESLINRMKCHLILSYLLETCQVDIIEIKIKEHIICNLVLNGTITKEQIQEKLYSFDVKERKFTCGNLTIKIWYINSDSKQNCEVCCQIVQLLNSLNFIPGDKSLNKKREERVRSNVFAGYVFHLNDFIEEYKDKKDKIAKRYGTDPRFRVFIKVLQEYLSKVIENILKNNTVKMTPRFVLSHPSGNGMYFFTKDMLEKFDSLEKLKSFIKSPQDMMRRPAKPVGLLPIVMQNNRYGPIWSIYNEKEGSLPEVVQYIKESPEIAKIEKDIFFPKNSDNKIAFQVAIPFITIGNMDCYLYLLGYLKEIGQVQEMRQAVKEVHKFLFLMAPPTYEFLSLLKKEWTDKQLKKDLIEPQLRYNEEEKKGLFIKDNNFVKAIIEFFTEKGEERRRIFELSGKGWFDQFFTYTFTEDIYNITLRTVKKVLEVALEKCQYQLDVKAIKENLFKTLDIFYTFQEQAKTSSIDYRDHLLHQFQVFLVGLKILSSGLFANAFNKDEIPALLFCWTIVSLFHDIGYPFEKINKVQIEYIKSLLRIRGENLRPDKVSQDIFFGELQDSNNEYRELIRELADMLELGIKGIKGKTSSKDLNWFFKKIFVEERNHAVTSAFYVYHNILRSMDSNFKWKEEAISTILVHDKRVWIEACQDNKENRATSRMGRYIAWEKFKEFKGEIRTYNQKKFSFKKSLLNLLRDGSGKYWQGGKEMVMEDMVERTPWVKNWKKSPYSKKASKESSDILFFMLNHFYKKTSLLKNFEFEIKPKEQPLQFLLLLTDTLQIRGRELGQSIMVDTVPKIGFEAKNGELEITVKKQQGTVEYLKLYLDFYLLNQVIPVLQVEPEFSDDTQLEKNFFKIQI